MQFLLCSLAKRLSRYNVAVLLMLATVLACSPLVNAQEAVPVDQPASAPVEAPAAEPAPVQAEPVPAVEAAPIVEPAPVEPAPVVDPAPVPDDGAGDAIVPPSEPEESTVPEEPVTTQPDQDVNPIESEEDPAETSGNDPGGETPTESQVPVTEPATATETPTPSPTAAESPTPSPTVAPATPAPTVTPSPTPEPTPVISWSQSNPISCLLHEGNAQTLEPGDTATWSCQASIATEITGDAPEDLHVLWQIGANYDGDDVQLTLPEGSSASVVAPDPAPGGTSELVTYRSNWADGHTLTFDVTVTRTTCVVGEAPLTLNASVDVKTADTSVQITRSGANPVDTQLASAAAPNLDSLVVSMQPVDFGTLEWNGESWGTANATTRVTVSNDQPCATSRVHLVQVEIVASNPGMAPVVSSVNVPESALISVTAGDPNTAAVGIASVPAGFEGTAEVEILFVLSPTLEVDAGAHTFGFQVTVVPAP